MAEIELSVPSRQCLGRRIGDEATLQREVAALERYILITQCLQNDFFLNKECRLRLLASEARKVLLGVKNTGWGDNQPGPKLPLPAGYPDQDHLGRFLMACTERVARTGPLDEAAYMGHSK